MFYFRSWCYEILFVSFFLYTMSPQKKKKLCRHLDPSLTCYNNAIPKKMQSMVMWNRQASFLFYIVNIYRYKDLFAQGLEL